MTERVGQPETTGVQGGLGRRSPEALPGDLQIRLPLASCTTRGGAACVQKVCGNLGRCILKLLRGCSLKRVAAISSVSACRVTLNIVRGAELSSRRFNRMFVALVSSPQQELAAAMPKERKICRQKGQRIAGVS